MSASEHINPRQLKLFYTARELMDLPALDTQYGESLRDDVATHDFKLNEARTGDEDFAHSNPAKSGELTLLQSISVKGVKEPVELTLYRDEDLPVLSNGHHRVVAAHHINPDMFIIPKYRSTNEHDSMSSGSLSSD